LLGVVAHPEFATNKTIFLYASIGDVANRHKVLKATVADDNSVSVDLRNPIIDRGLEGPANHNGGGLIIHKGHLYVSVGDTGANSTPPRNKYASCLNKPNGKILRVQLDGAIPADNPLSSLNMVTGCDSVSGDFGMRAPDKRIFAWGMRNAYRFWIDPTTDLLWIGDVGETTREEISVGGKGTHFGYPFEEGTVKYQQPWNMGCKGMSPSTDCVPPVFDYQNVRNGTNCVIGGLVPDGCGWPDAYKSKYFFGDHGSGNLWTLDLTPDRRGVVRDSRKAFGQLPRISGFRMGHDHSLYLISHDRGVIAKVTPKNRPASCLNASAPADAGAPVDAASTAADASSNPTADASRDSSASTGGSSGTGGTSGTGGMAGSSGAGAAGGSVGTGGAGTPRPGGTTGSMADAATDDDPGDPDTMANGGGCGCGVGGTPGPGALAFFAALIALGVRRRRASRR
jgi:MYXO-CTERM domain-containing protein